ncbi:hypothetical protein SKAU_G00191250 [Synaphobranchus kaupii]|uniref:Uncharacterized protein n=1 Tax=Synaphobranchus kaupii TaxID=118154 RepID=A0A9Q1FDS2_SYNKA|nr:hypothetical protein SKAU_G00191250 [Synaphobranchus kaupii]
MQMQLIAPLGDSYIRHGEERARETMGISLGLDARVHWFGWGGLRRPSFGNPSDDLGKFKSLDLIAEIKRDLQDLHRHFTWTKIFLSGITM